jgi:hypothetical protein
MESRLCEAFFSIVASLGVPSASTDITGLVELSHNLEHTTILHHSCLNAKGFLSERMGACERPEAAHMIKKDKHVKAAGGDL